jgi:hypothetical protein
LDFGLLRDVDASRVAAERAIAVTVRDGDAVALKAALGAGGYLPASRADAVDADFALSVMRMAIKWYAAPGERRFSPADTRRDSDRERPDREERASMRMQLNQFTLPPEAILIRRMHGIVAVVLAQLRAGADWGAIAAEYLHGEPPSTPLGEAEAGLLRGPRSDHERRPRGRWLGPPNGPPASQVRAGSRATPWSGRTTGCCVALGVGSCIHLDTGIPAAGCGSLA